MEHMPFLCRLYIVHSLLTDIVGLSPGSNSGLQRCVTSFFLQEARQCLNHFSKAANFIAVKIVRPDKSVMNAGN